MKFRKQDIEGRQIRIGDTVRIIGLPDLSTMSAVCRAESQPVFQRLVGKYKQIVGFNKLGMVELFLRNRNKRKVEMHTVWIEPKFLRLKQNMASNQAKHAIGAKRASA